MARASGFRGRGCGSRSTGSGTITRSGAAGSGALVTAGEDCDATGAGAGSAIGFGATTSGVAAGAGGAIVGVVGRDAGSRSAVVVRDASGDLSCARDLSCGLYDVLDCVSDLRGAITGSVVSSAFTTAQPVLAMQLNDKSPIAKAKRALRASVRLLVGFDNDEVADAGDWTRFHPWDCVFMMFRFPECHHRDLVRVNP